MVSALSSDILSYFRISSYSDLTLQYYPLTSPRSTIQNKATTLFMMSNTTESNQPTPELTQKNGSSVKPMVITRSNSDMMKTEEYGQNNLQSATESRRDPMDNELFVPLSGPLPTASPAVEAQKTSAPSPTPPEPPKATKPIRGRPRKNPFSTPESEPVKKKKVTAVKPSPVESDPLDFTEAKPDATTMMGFALPKINHGGTRPARVPRHLYSSPSIDDMDDENAVERAFRDLLAVREVVDWESRRLGRRLWLLRKRGALEEQREEARRSKMWEQDNGSLEEEIKKLQAESGKIDK